MRVLKIQELPEKPMAGATPIRGWSGGPVARTRQTVIGDGTLPTRPERHRPNKVAIGQA